MFAQPKNLARGKQESGYSEQHKPVCGLTFGLECLAFRFHCRNFTDKALLTASRNI